ncbi:unnamed protein product [Ectocarpus sp. 8 AP-2014]
MPPPSPSRIVLRTAKREPRKQQLRMAILETSLTTSLVVLAFPPLPCGKNQTEAAVATTETRRREGRDCKPMKRGVGKGGAGAGGWTGRSWKTTKKEAKFRMPARNGLRCFRWGLLGTSGGQTGWESSERRYPGRGEWRFCSGSFTWRRPLPMKWSGLSPA